jgi:hypothetical protein
MNSTRFLRQPLPGSRGRVLRGTLDFAAIDDHARLPWRFLARHMAVDDLSPA